jgi:leucyl-tRNA synthetase
MRKYFSKEIEAKWQAKWLEKGIYKTERESKKEKKYILDMFPYPSGEGLHVGHFKLYVSSDIIARYYSLKGFNVLHPMGWDAFGLPAENYAIRTGIHPKITTEKNISNIKAQMQLVGLSYDWDREINTTDPNYYKWTQWIFLKLFEHGLAYEDEAPINWCPKDKTGLANEEVVNGRCDRCGEKVERKVIRQWILRITKYADRLLEDLEGLNWPEFIKEMQVNWIGRSEGSVVKFDIENKEYVIETFTTRVDTLAGATALVLAPEHPRTKELMTNEQKADVEKYLEQVEGKSDLERTELNKEKTGVFTGSYAINPITSKRIPIWIADYVLGFYGTGAVMVVPASDERDFEFASKFKIDVIEVVKPEGKEVDLPYMGPGKLVNSAEFDGLDNIEAKKIITNWLKEKGKGEFQITYKLRDWIFSRQRYWGEPIPIIHCEKCGTVGVSESELPLLLPEVEKYEPTGTGESPLATINEWVNTKCPKCGGAAKRETNTMPQWAGSCWYYLRFCDPYNDVEIIAKDIERYLMPVDWYLGGAEHAVLHLLYSRFWHKFLFDIGVVKSKEPFMKLSSIGLVLGPDGAKMSKSKGNVITPENVVNEYGADTLRVYEAFMGPFENTISWDPGSINGVYRFLNRVWEVVLRQDEKELDISIDRALAKLAQKVSSDIENLKCNTPIAAMMEFINFIFHKSMSVDQKKKFLIILSPFAPHLTEELWESLGQEFSVHEQSWPDFENINFDDEEVIVVIQVNGKVRDSVKVSKSISEQEVNDLAKKSEKVRTHIAEKEIKKSIYIPGKVLNLVV